MADWTGLAGAAGLAAALEEIQGRRIKEAQLQKELTAGQGEWMPATGGMGGSLGFFDALFGHNQPGHIGFGSQRYQFRPYDPVTPEQAKAWGMTYPETVTTPERLQELPTGFHGPPELIPAQETTRDVPIPGIVGMRLGPKEKMALFQEQLKERRELAKLDREQQFWKQLRAGQGGGTATATEGTFALDGTGATGTTGTTGTAQPAVTPAAGQAVGGGPVPGIDKLSPQFRAKAQLVANRLGINLDDFYRVMHFETGGEFSPATKNRARSGATGLIQFTKRAAEGLGTTTDALAKMTPEQQLDYVEKYLTPHKGKIGNLKDLYLSILYPAAIGKSDDTVLFTPDKNPLEYRQNAGLDTGKKGYVTVGDAVAAVQRTTGAAPTTTAGTPPAPAGAPAQTPAQPGTSMMVAGPGAPAPSGTTTAATTGTGVPSAPAATSPTVPAQAPATGQPPATAQEPFQLSQEARRVIERNNQQTIALNAKLQKLRADQEQVLSSRLAGTPRGTVELQRITSQMSELEKDRNNLLKASQELHEKELGEHRKKGTKVGEEGRKPPLEAEVKTAVQDAEMSEDLRATKHELVSAGQSPDKAWKEYTSQEKALVQRTYAERKQEATNIEKMNEWERTALFQITKDEGTPQGRATESQLRRARVEGRKNELAFEQQKKVALSEANLDAVMGETDALRWIHPVTRQPATNMTPRQAKDAGYLLMAKPQQDTLRNGYNSIQYVDRLNTLYFGGKDKDGSITGQAGTDFEGIYPWVERTRKETQTLGARVSQTAAVRTGLLQGKTMAQWARVADNFIDASLGAISRDLGGERGHFTDVDAQRARQFFTNFGSSWWGKTLGNPNLMKTSGEARDMMGLVTGVISDRVRGALDLAPGDALPWNIQGTLLPKPLPPSQRQPSGTPTTGQAIPGSGTKQGTVPTTGTPAATQEPAPTPRPAQEPAPAPAGGAPKKLDGPTAQRILNEATQALFPGRAPATLSDDEIAQARARARSMWQQQGGH